LHAAHINSRVLQVGHGSVEGGYLNVRQHDLHVRATERTRQCKTDAASRARYERHLVPQIMHLRFSQAETKDNIVCSRPQTEATRALGMTLRKSGAKQTNV
jgi:hypothetical protein